MRDLGSARRILLIGGTLVTAYSVIALVAGLLRAPGWEPIAVVAQFAAAGLAAAAAFRTAVRRTGPWRRAWSWIAAGAVAWGLGAGWRAARELIAGQPVPVPSLADVGFLLLPVCIGVGLLVHPAARATHAVARLRLVTDGVTITLTLLILAWHLPAAVLPDPSAPTATRMITLAHAVCDVLLVAMLCTLLVHGATRLRRHLLWLLAAVLLVSGADGVFSIHAQQGPGSATPLAALLWAAGFLAITVAAGTEPGEESARPADRATSDVLPYVLIVVVGGLVTWHWFTGAPVGTPTTIMITALVLLTFLRQRLLLLDNRRLHGQIDLGMEQLRRSSIRDTLTGLPNRGGFLELTARALTRHPELPFAVAKLEAYHSAMLDHLPADEADAIIAATAARIRGCLRAGDRLARVGEATFAVLMTGDRTEAVRLTQNVLLALDQPLTAAQRRVHIKPTAGIATVRADDPERSAAALIREAAIALSGSPAVPGAITVLTPAMLDEHSHRLKLREAVIAALRAEPVSGIHVLFEPVVELGSGRLGGVAARASWSDERHGTVEAGRLTAMVRETGLTDRVDTAVIDTAVVLFGLWNRRWNDTCGELWITVCTETLAAAGFPGRLGTLLDTAGVPAHALVLELLDGVDGFDARACGAEARLNLQRLRATGVRFAASDAMVLSGYSPTPDPDHDTDADYFDIPPLLVNRCVTDVRARRLVQATAEFAATRGARTAARQVTTVEQHEELLQAGCTLARGPLYGVSMPEDKVVDVLAAVAAGTWRTEADLATRRHRSSRAWQGLREVISGLPIATFACNVAGEVILAEGALLRDLDLAEDPVDHPLSVLFGDEEPVDGHRALSEVLGEALGGTSSVTTLPVRGRWLQIHVSPGRSADGVVTGALGVAIDVTPRVQMERAVRDSEQQFKSIFEHAPMGMIIVSPSGQVLQSNAALEAITGWSPEEYAGRPVSEFMFEENLELATANYVALMSGAVDRFHVEQTYKCRDGTPGWARVSVAALQGANEPGTLIAIVEDLRQFKQLEVELRHAQKLEAVGMLAAGIAHEINTPIQFVGDNLNFLTDVFGQFTEALTETRRLCRPVDDAAGAEVERLVESLDLPWLMEEVPNAVRQSLEGVGRVASIVSAMRNFGHPDASDPSPIDVNAAIRDTTTVARSEFKYVADLELDLGEIPPVPGYPSQFHQVILNLVVNAAHAISDTVAGTERRGTIHIRSRADQRHVHVTVADDGCGMSAETSERIFDPFFTTKDVGRGTGQGLTITHSIIVDKHHGSINVDSTQGQGTTFTVSLPLRSSRMAADGKAPAPALNA